MKYVNKFPQCFPPNFESEILPAGADFRGRVVYRVMKYGKIDRNSFLGTYQEIVEGLMPPPRKPLDMNDPGTYSTSCYEKRSDLEYFLKVTMRREPAAFIAKGITCGECGPSQLSSDRKTNTHKDSSHVDWWIYESASPELYFKEDKTNE